MGELREYITRSEVAQRLKTSGRLRSFTLRRMESLCSRRLEGCSPCGPASMSARRLTSPQRPGRAVTDTCVSTTQGHPPAVPMEPKPTLRSSWIRNRQGDMASAPGWQRTPFLQSIDELMTYGSMVYMVVIPARLRVRKYKIPDISLTHKHTSIYVGMREPRIRSTHSWYCHVILCSWL
jgi:hypothetical protein